MNDAEEIKKRIDIVEFLGQYLQLKKAGINHSAVCPFHEEKTPSFMVSPQRQSYKCFGCGKSGDAISFFMEMEGLSFPEALRILGEKVGVQVSTRPKEELDREKSMRDKLFNINLIAAKYYKAVLRQEEGSRAIDYLTKRKIPENIIEKFKIGYAPAHNTLDRYFTKYKFSSKEVTLAGNPQKFKYRVIFPIFDVLGFVVGFSGRVLEAALPAGFSANPKYLNTPETPIFHKSRCLYGLNLAKDSIRKNKRVVVVEGQMDVISSHIAGVEEVVATSGTALTQEHLKILKRYTSNIIFAFDEDEAGQKAALGAISMALLEDLDVRLTIIDKYKDVGELVESNSSEWEQVVDRSLPPVEWLVSRAKMRKATLEAKDKKDLVIQAVSIIKQMQDEVERAHYVSYLAHAVGVPTIAIEKSMSKIKVQSSEERQITVVEKDLELDILSFVANYPNLLAKIEMPKGEYFTNNTYREFYKKLHECYNSGSKVGDCLSKLMESCPDDLKQKVTASAIGWDGKIEEDQEEALAEFVDISNRIKHNRKELIKAEFARKISQAESEGNMTEVRDLMKKLQESF